MRGVLNVFPLATAAREVGITYPGLTDLIARGEVRVVKDRAGKRYLPASEVDRLKARYADRQLKAAGTR